MISALNPWNWGKRDHNNANSMNALNVYSEQDRIARDGVDDKLYVIMGDREAERLQKFAKTMMSYYDQSVEMRVTAWFNVNKTIANGVGRVDKLYVTIDRKYIQLGMVESNTVPKLTVNYYYARTNDFDRGTLQIAMNQSRSLNLVANIIRLIIKWTASASSFGTDRATRVQVTGHGYLSEDGFSTEFIPLIKALQRRKVLADHVVLEDIDRGIVKQITITEPRVAQAAAAPVSPSAATSSVDSPLMTKDSSPPWPVTRSGGGRQKSKRVLSTNTKGKRTTSTASKSKSRAK